MAIKSNTTLKTYFETGDHPNQSQFIDLIDTMTQGAGVVNVLDYYNNETTYDTAFTNAIAALTKYSTLLIPKGTFTVNNKVNVNKGFVNIICYGRILASDTFSDDFLFQITRESTTDFYNWPVRITGELYLDCNFKTRGFYCYRLDHINWNSIRVERPWGSGVRIDRIRESEIYSTRVINGQARDAFSTPAVWNSGTSYIVGDRVIRNPAAYSGATNYQSGQTALGSDGNPYLSILDENTGNDPISNPDKWAKLPYEFYQCLIAHTNQDPNTQNSNNVTSGNRYWLRVYQDEAAISVVDEVQDSGDRSNQVNLYSPIVRDSSYKCLLRIDNNRADSYLTHINVWGGHLHYLDPAISGSSSYPNITTQNGIRVIEIGRCQNINIVGTQIRLTNSQDAIGVLVGGLDGGTKTPSSMRISYSPITGEGDRQRGLVVNLSAVTGNGSCFNVCPISLTGANTTEIIDPERVFREVRLTEFQINLPAGLESAPKVFEAIVASAYTDARPFVAQRQGDTSPRFEVQMAGTTNIRFGSGTATVDTQFGRSSANFAVMASGDSFGLDGNFDGGRLVLGGITNGIHIFRNGAQIRASIGAPTSAGSGALIGTATTA
jgi:hypothetical protein